MNRRTFLTRSGLALGALIVGEAALDELARLTHVRKSFPSAAVPRPMTLIDYAKMSREVRYANIHELFMRKNPYLDSLHFVRVA